MQGWITVLKARPRFQAKGEAGISAELALFDKLAHYGKPLQQVETMRS
jgi:hypothetical protein